MENLIGKMVKINWKNPDDDWLFFNVLSFYPPLIHLQGADDPTSSLQHFGDDFYVNVSEIKLIQEWKEKE